MMRYLRVFIMLFGILFACTGFASANRYVTLHYRVTGITNPEMQKNVSKAMQNLYSKLHFPLTTSETQRFVDKAPIEIQNAITPYGYFRSKIQSSFIKGEKVWHTQFNVTLGPTLPIISVQTEIRGAGKTDPEFIKWQSKLPLRVNQTLQTDLYDKAKTELYDLSIERGYFQAKMIQSQIRINLVQYHARIIIIFDTGPRARIGETTYRDSPFHKKFLDRFLSYHQGEYYNAKALEKSQANFIAADYFSQVIIKPKPKEIVNGYVPIKVDVIARKAKEYTFGLGYGTDTGARGTAGVTLRRLGGEGHRFQTVMRASQQNSSIIAKYLIPGYDPAHDLIIFSGGATSISQATGSAHNGKIGAAYSVTRGKWKHSATLAYLTERYNINTLPNTSTQLVFPIFSTKYATVDHKLRPHNGFSFEAQLTGANRHILSETTFSQFTAEFKSLYTIEATKTRLLLRANGGYTNISQLYQLPLSLQLFAGGSSSVRGYSYNSLGPGRNLSVGSIEVQERIWGDFYFAGFIDAGAVGNTNIYRHLNAGSGPGIAWLSPVGTLELTYAEGFTLPNQPWTIQFTMGTDL